jgi:hypothetical protein
MAESQKKKLSGREKLLASTSSFCTSKLVYVNYCNPRKKTLNYRYAGPDISKLRMSSVVSIM